MKVKLNCFQISTAAFLAALAAIAMLLCGWHAAPRGGAAVASTPPCAAPRGGAAAVGTPEEVPPDAAGLRALAARSLGGDAGATFELARRVELGIGTAPDPAEAAQWYEVAEEQGCTLPEEVVTRLFP